jgi:hypothetical protein
MVTAIGRKAVSVDNLFIRSVRLPSPINTAINEKYVAQQEALREQYKVQEAAERYRVSYINAQAERMTQELVNEGMSEAFLRWRGIGATRELAASPNAKFVIAGGKDGLPIILNPEAGAAGKEAPAPPQPGMPLSKRLNKEGPTEPDADQATPPPASLLPAEENASMYMRRIGKDIIDSLTDQFRTVVPDTSAPPSVNQPSPHGASVMNRGQ